MPKMPYGFDLLYDLSDPERIVQEYRWAVSKASGLREILHHEIHGVKRNNGLVLSAKDIDGEETHKVLLEMQVQFDRIDKEEKERSNA